MTWAELQQAAGELGAFPDRRAKMLAALAADPRFPAVVSLVEDLREGYVRAFSHQKMAAHPGNLAHAAGSVHALDTFQQHLQEALRPRPRPRAAGPPLEA
jgi:hypothetical protein